MAELTTDHFLEDLLARVDRHGVHLVTGYRRLQTTKTHVLVPLGLDEVELPVVAEGAPLGVDDHVVLLVEALLVEGLDVLDVLEVAGVGAGAQDEADATTVVLPGATGGARVGVTIFLSCEFYTQVYNSNNK